MMLQDAWREGANTLRAHDVDSPLIDARLMLQFAVEMTYEQFIMHSREVMTPAQEKTYNALIRRRANREPIAQILGYKEFFGRPFKVTKDVLTPRPDSEVLVEGVLSRIRDRDMPLTILDLGTGSGCLLLTLLAHLPNATGLGVDKSEAALGVARQNAFALKLASRADFRVGEWCHGLPQKKYEIVVANPPYIPSNDVRTLMPEVGKYEPLLALDGGADGLECYRDIAACLPPYLATYAIVAIEVGAGQHDAVGRIMANEHCRLDAIHNDLSGIPRCMIFTT